MRYGSLKYEFTTLSIEKVKVMR